MPKAFFNAYVLYPSELYDIVREALHRIGDIDYHHDAEIIKVDAALFDEVVKNYIKDKIRLVHQKERQPYVDLLSTLRSKQQS